GVRGARGAPGHGVPQPRRAPIPVRRAVEGRGGASEAVGAGQPAAGAVACPRIDPEDPQDTSLSGDGAGPGTDRGDPGGASRGGGEAGRSRPSPDGKQCLKTG